MFWLRYANNAALLSLTRYGLLCMSLTQVGPIPERVLACMTFQILWGLAYLKHDKRVHRDLKPSNLLINSRGEIKVSSHFYLCLNNI